MLAEAAHSIADTINQVFLLFSLELGERPPDAEHPFGHGKERFFWAFLAAVGIFVAGAGFSLYEGLRADLRPAVEHGSFTVVYAVLAFALLADGLRSCAHCARRAREASERRQSTRATSARAAIRHQDGPLRGLRGGRRRRPGLRGRRAAPGNRRSGLRRPGLGRDRRAADLVAVALGRDTKDLLIGEAATPEERKAITRDHRGRTGGRPRARAVDDGAVARPPARGRAHRPGRRHQRRRDRTRVERDRPRVARAHSHGVAGLPRRDPAQRGARGRTKTGRKRPTPERPPHRLGCQKAISPPAGVATTLRQPAGPSRASSRTAAPRPRARSVAAAISATST